MKKIAYQLLALRLTQENLETAERERFSFAERGQLLLYQRAGRRRPKGAVLVPPSTRLSPTAQQWLKESNLTLLKEFAAGHEEEGIAGAADFLKQFERELAMEREQMQGARGRDRAEK